MYVLVNIMSVLFRDVTRTRKFNKSFTTTTARRFQSDQGDQLVAASKQLVTWDWARVDELCSQKGATWRLVPTGGQHYNGQAERVIGLMKLCLAQTLEGK
jgi:hypothetical protein